MDVADNRVVAMVQQNAAPPALQVAVRQLNVSGLKRRTASVRSASLLENQPHMARNTRENPTCWLLSSPRISTSLMQMRGLVRFITTFA